MKKFFQNTYFAIILLLIYVPIGVMVFFSFNSGSTVFSWAGFSTEAYKELFTNSPFLKSILTSVFVAVVSTMISLIIGVAAAIGLGRTKPITQKAWFNIANIPLINADVVTAVSLMIVFLLLQFPFGIGSLILAHISFNVPYVLITVFPRLRKIDKSLIEAASDLGAKQWQVIWKVILPTLRPAIITAAVLAFSMSFDDFIISYFMGGDQTNVSTFIYTAKRIRPYIFAFGTLLVSVIVFFVIIWNMIQLIQLKKAETTEQIKQGWYKSKELNKAYQELESLYSQLNNQTRIYISKNPANWTKYWWYEFVLKLYSIRNYDRKISKLEWKQYKLKNKISNESRYYSQLKSTNKSIAKLEAEIEKKSTDIKNLKKVAKLQLRLDQLVDKRDFLESEIAWIENRNERQADKIEKINKRLKALIHEFNANKHELSKKDLSWYQKKIKTLTDYKIELEEGKNNYNLRMVVEQLRETQELRNNKIYELENKVDKAYGKVKQVRPADSFYKGIHFNEDKRVLAKDAYLTKEINKLEEKIGKQETKIAKLHLKVEKKRAQVFPPDNNEEGHTKSWFARSWKILTVSILGVVAFSGLTVAYVQNNVYDLTIGNWGEYIDPRIINEFQKKTGYRINYQAYDSNETLYNKLYTFRYDVMVPSDYMIQQLAEENKLHELDYARLQELQVEDGTEAWSTADYATYLKDGPFADGNTFQFNKYAVPYFWGDVSIVFNLNSRRVRDLLDENSLSYTPGAMNQTIDQVNWEIINQAIRQGLRVSLNNDPKNLFLIANEILFQQANALSRAEIDQSYNYLKSMIGNRGNVSLQGDDMLSTVINGEFDLAVMYSGDATLSVREFLSSHPSSQPFALARPNAAGQGTNIYFDGMVLSKKTPHETAAYRFINFMHDKAAMNSLYVGLASPFESVLEELANGEFADFSNWYRPSTNGEQYVANRELDQYLVGKFNDLLA